MILCIDTVTHHAGIAVIGHKQCLAYMPLKQGHYGESIVSAIDETLKKAKATSQDITGVLTVLGPGSFTSLRVGLSVANQFAHQLKIPIRGLRTEEWWRSRTDETSALYLQSMNREEVYDGGKIIPITEPSGTKSWLGELTDDHRAKLPKGFTEITDLKSPEETWLTVANAIDLPHHQKYDLLEPFYGKEPTITQPKPKRSQGTEISHA